MNQPLLSLTVFNQSRPYFSIKMLRVEWDMICRKNICLELDGLEGFMS